VEVADKLTETRTTLINPNGTFILRTHAQPVRTKKNGAWRGVDTTLAATGDGSLAPVAAPAGMTFSGGGTVPLVTLVDGEKKLALSWPTPLPVPTISGPTATYPDVYPGVDLQVTAGAIGYSEVLVVHTAEAAKNPALAEVKLNAATTGLTLSSSADDVLSAKDSTGAVVFHGSTPIMWDSTSDGKPGSAPTATDPSGGKTSKLSLTTTTVTPSSAEVVVGTDHAALTGKDVKYPVFIDPVMSRYQEAWAEVTDNGWHYWNANMNAQVGYCNGWADCNGTWRAHSYFRFITSDLQVRNGVKAVVFDATLYATQVHGTSCTEQPVTVHQTFDFDENTRWPGPLSHEVTRGSSSAGDQCGGARDIAFDLINSVKDVVTFNSPWLNLGLLPDNENDRNQWKKFANNPHLDVTFAFPPNPAEGLALSNAITCGGKIVTPDSHPTLSATATDNNEPPLNLGLWFELFTEGGTTRLAYNDDAVTIASDTTGAWPADLDLGNGDYGFRVADENQFPGDSEKNLWSGAWSDWLKFTALSKPITQQPTIKSSDYPADYWGRQQDMPGTFTFDANGAEHLAGFTYSFTGSGTQRVPTSSDCDYNKTFGTNGGWVSSATGSATITVPATLSPGYHTVHVRSFDAAHKLSPESQAYTFYVAPTLIPAAPVKTFEAEDLTATLGSATTKSVISHANASGGKYLAANTTIDGSGLSVAFTVTSDGFYDVTTGMIDDATLPDQVEYTLDGKVVSNLYAGGASTTVGRVAKLLAGVRLTAGNHTIGLRIIKKAGSTATTFKTGLDYVRLSPTVQLDAEALPLIESSRAIAPQLDCCTMSWRGGAQLRFEGDSIGQYFTLRLTTPVEADYAVGMGMTKSFHQGKYAISIDDTPLARTDLDPIDAYRPSVTSVYQPLGGIHLTAGEHKITFTAVGTNPASTELRYRIGVDYLTVQPINNVTTASFIDAANNKGISTDGSSTGASLDTSGNSLSSQTLAAAGLAPGASATINGATFTMPARNTTTGNDNVIAMGQTIPFPTTHQVKANGVGLLVASTCGSTKPITGTVTYTDGSTSHPMFPSVRDWTTLPLDQSGITLPYRNTGATPEFVYQPTIYPIFVPADPNKTLKSITLPNYGTSDLVNTCTQSNALHVLSMAPRTAPTGWVSAWSAPADAAVPPPGGTGFANRTLRTVVHPTITGASVRIRLSNDNVTVPVTIGAASLGAQSGTESATLATPVALKFGGNATVTIPAGGEVLSDPITTPSTIGGSGNFVVSVHLPNAVANAPVHEGATAPSYSATGNQTANATGAPFTTTLTGSYYLSRLDLTTTDANQGTVVVLGDQFTAAGPAGSGQRDTWVDKLPAKLDAVSTPLPGGLVNASRNGIPDTGRWKLNDGTGTIARDSAGQNHATTSGGVTWSTDHNGSVNLNGTTGALATSTKVLDTSTSFSVSAWLKITKRGAYQTAISQDGNVTSAFFLQYSAEEDRWAFTVHQLDQNDPPGSRAYSVNAPELNKWTHLIGVYDAPSKTVRLYVNGNLEGSISSVPTFRANGPLIIGRAKFNGSPDDHLSGSISDVRAYQRALTPKDAVQTYSEFRATGYGPYPNNASVAAGNIEQALERSALSAPNIRTVLVSVGANDLLAGVSATAVKTDLTNMMDAGSPYGLKRTLRYDGTPIHLIMTTVPPLGLAANDPREAERRQLNTMITTNSNNFGADEFVDFDAAVRKADDVSKIDPNFLTNGVINDRYHDKIAQAMAEACSDFPPRAEL